MHTQKYIYAQHMEKHNEMCERWRTAPTKEDALVQFRKIRAWWATGKAADRNIPKLDSWLSWWHYRASRWGHFIIKVCYVCFFFYELNSIAVIKKPTGLGLSLCNGFSMNRMVSLL